MLDQRRIEGIAIRKFDHPLFIFDVEQSLGAGTAHRDASRKQALLVFRYGLISLNLADQLPNRIGIAEGRQRAEASRQILLRGCGHSKSAESVIARKIEILEQRQPRRPVEVTDHALSPAIRSGIIHRACGDLTRGGKKRSFNQRYVLAERKTILKPAVRVPKRHAARCAHEFELTDKCWLSRVEQEPQIKTVREPIVGRR